MHSMTRDPASRRALKVVRPAALFAGAVLILSVMPFALALPAEGIWIFPHARQMDAVGESLDDTFYIGESENMVLADSFFADASPDAAHVQVDLYNPTGDTLLNVQLFAALSDAEFFGSISFAGGLGGETSYDDVDSLSAGTPFGLDTHDVYPTYYASYAVGDNVSQCIQDL